MTWIKTVPFEVATGRLRKLYERVTGPGNNVDNIMMAHSLRPHSMEGHMALYKNVLHHTGNSLPKWVLELLGVRVSHLNGCDYCVRHHAAGLRRLLADEARADAVIGAATGDGGFEGIVDPSVQQMLVYAEQLTSAAQDMDVANVEALRAVGLEDGQILEVNQVVAYFAYANRTVLGLGVNTDGDVIGLSPGSDNPDEWGHH
ncbi:MAG: peroxidase-related enzyme [Marinibacterium sp.]|nr:peroxidase-related enzyme [Marinibacterium sp.]